MYEFIEGKIEYATPSAVCINCSGVGYHLEISLTTYTDIKTKQEGRLFTHYIVREDAHQLFGFSCVKERELFRYLISVNGIGANTARMMLSSMNTDELLFSIVKEDINAIKSVKGIGLKTAQRVVLELKEVLSKIDVGEAPTIIHSSNKNREEALLALQTLGFNKLAADKVLDKLLKENTDASVELLIKQALKFL